MGSCYCKKKFKENIGLSEQLLSSNKLSIYTVTWNVNTQEPMKSESFDFLLKTKETYDIYVIGLQEIINKRNDNTKIEKLWKICLAKTLGSNYIFTQSIYLMGILLLIFVKNVFKEEIANIKSSTTGSGLFGIIKNNNAVSITFTFFDTSICIICCHLSSKQENIQENIQKKNENYHKMMQKLMFSKKHKSDDEKNDNKLSEIFESDIVIIFGDINYKLDYNNRSFEKVYKLIEKKEWKKLLLKDELLNERNAGNIFKGFNENIINFKPSFKFIPNTNEYDYNNNKNIPYWCDRILWKSNNIDNKMKCI